MFFQMFEVNSMNHLFKHINNINFWHQNTFNALCTNFSSVSSRIPVLIQMKRALLQTAQSRWSISLFFMITKSAALSCVWQSILATTFNLNAEQKYVLNAMLKNARVALCNLQTRKKTS